MRSGKFSGFEIEVRDPGIAWITFNRPEAMNAMNPRLKRNLDEIAAKTAISDHHPDAREGGTAFLQKRKPHFNRWLEKKAAAKSDEEP
ncbi:MAG: hypothetical protein VX466_16095 [Myxococcota bacterium]|nr:hypothetical protein [Myxococcota bacterium]